jgi:hypothetical protein
MIHSNPLDFLSLFCALGNVCDYDISISKKEASELLSQGEITMPVDTSHSASVQKSNQDNPVAVVPQKVVKMLNPQSRITTGLRAILSSAARAEDTCTLSKPIKCDQPGCNCEFKRQDGLTRHKRQKHPDCHLSGKWESEQPRKRIENSSNDRKTRSKPPAGKVEDTEMLQNFHSVIDPVKKNTANSPVVETDGAKGAQEKTKGNMVISTSGKETEEKEAMLMSKEYKCTQPGCGKEYGTSRSLSGHVTKYHPNVQREERTKKVLEIDEEAFVAKSPEPVKKNTAKSLGSEKDRAKGAQEKMKDKVVIKMKDNMVVSIAGTEAEKEKLTSKEYKCTQPGCGKEYGTSRSLSGHVAKYHPNVPKGEREKMPLEVDEEAMMAYAEETMAQWDVLQAEKAQGKNNTNDPEPSRSREVSKRGKRNLSLPSPQTIKESPPQKKPKTIVAQPCTLCHARRKKCERLGGPNDPCKVCVEKNLECIPRLKKGLHVEIPTQSFFSEEEKDPTKAYTEKVVGKKWRVFGLKSKRGQGINGKIGYCRGVTFPTSKAVAFGGAETFLHVAIEGIPTMQYKCVNLELVDEGN